MGSAKVGLHSRPLLLCTPHPEQWPVLSFLKRSREVKHKTGSIGVRVGIMMLKVRFNARAVGISLAGFSRGDRDSGFPGSSETESATPLSWLRCSGVRPTPSPLSQESLNHGPHACTPESERNPNGSRVKTGTFDMRKFGSLTQI